MGKFHFIVRGRFGTIATGGERYASIAKGMEVEGGGREEGGGGNGAEVRWRCNEWKSDNDLPADVTPKQ